MRIESLHIYGFGEWQDEFFSFAPGLNVIVGENEAGKTSMMAFVRAVFFGFEKRSLPHLRYEPRGGKFGGMITLVDEAAGEEYRVERVGGAGGRSAGDVRVYLPDGATGGEEHLQMLLGKMNEKVFKSIFAFGLTELQQIETLQQDEVNGFLYHTGTGSGLSILNVQKQLTVREERYFKKNGQRHRLALTLRELDKERSAIVEIRGRHDEYNRLVEQMEQVEAALLEQNRLVEELERRVRWQEQVVQQEETYFQWQEQVSRLHALPEVEEFPEQGVARLERIAEKVRELDAEMSTLRMRMEKEQQRLSAYAADERLLAHEDKIQELQQQLPRLQDRHNLLIERQHTLQELDDKLSAFCAHTALDWSDEEIAAFDLSLVQIQTVQEHVERARDLKEAEKALLLREGRAREEGDALQQEENRLIRHRDGLPYLPDDGSAPQVIDWLREQLLRAESMRRSGSEPGAKTGKEKWFLLAATVLLPILFFLLLQPLAAIVTLLVLGGFTAYIWRQKSSTTANPRRELAKLEAEAEQVLQPYGLSFTRDSLRVLEERLVQHRRWEGEWQALESKYESHDLLLERLRAERRTLDQDKASWRSAWTHWLRERNLSLELTPPLTEQILRELEGAQNVLRQKREAERTCVDIRAYLDVIHEQTRTLAQALGEKADLSTEIPPLLQKLAEQLRTERSKYAQRQSSNSQLSTWKSAWEEKEALLQTLLREQSHLFELAHVADEEAFRLKARQHAERLARTEERDRLQSQLLRAVGGPERWESFRDALAAGTPEERRTELHADRERLRGEKEALQTLNQRKGSLQKTIEDLQQDERLSAAQQQYQHLVAQLEQEARDWSVAAAARHLLQRTMQVYEREKQPDVIKRAAHYFSRLTEGRYPRLYVPLGADRKIEVERADGHRFEPAYLSRGTVEQLYLAMRFALVAEYRKQAVLPLIFDDIFVNFDPPRTQAALRTLEEIAGEQQILFFTCHPHLTDWCPQARITPLQQKADRVC